MDGGPCGKGAVLLRLLGRKSLASSTLAPSASRSAVIGHGIGPGIQSAKKRVGSAWRNAVGHTCPMRSRTFLLGVTAAHGSLEPIVLERGRPRFLSADPQDVGTVSAEHGSSAPVIPVMPHAAVCASTASMSARIRHEWPDRLWTVRILRPRKGGIRTCFRSPTGRGNSLRNCPVRVRTPAKAPAEATASTPPDPVRTSDGTGTMLR